MSSKHREIFLVVTIPTHLRVLMDTADLLQLSGRYAPVMVYYPSAVFDQNHANCQQAPHEAFIWTGSRFLSKADYLTGAWRSDSPARWIPNRRLSRWLPNRRLYRRLKSVFPFFPTPADLVSEVRRVIYMAVSVVRFVAGAYGIVRSALFSFIDALKSPTVQQESQRTFSIEVGCSDFYFIHLELNGVLRPDRNCSLRLVFVSV